MENIVKGSIVCYKQSQYHVSRRNNYTVNLGSVIIPYLICHKGVSIDDVLLNERLVFATNMRAQIEIIGLGKNADNDKVFIVDCDEGACSVTNDAEGVVKYVNGLYPDKRIIYRDSDGRWDELGHVNGVFVDFLPYSGWTPFKN